MYRVKEIYLTKQGEGYHTGRVAVFCRFAGCNLWSGHERDRAGAVCNFCDTDFVGTDGAAGGIYEKTDLVEKIAAICQTQEHCSDQPFVVLTGGEPLLQVDGELVDALHAQNFYIAVETNGSRPVSTPIDWICVSPKAGAAFVQNSGDELKLVYPQHELEPEQFENHDFKNFYLQPKDGPAFRQNSRRVVEYCLAHRRWQVSLQLHKYLGIP